MPRVSWRKTKFWRGQDPARFARVLAPKVQGAWLLHRLTRDTTA